MSRRPTYPLSLVHQLLHAGAYLITERAIGDAFDLGFDQTQIVAVVLELRPSDRYKSMPARAMPGLMQDVYRTAVGPQHLYVKLQIRGTAPDDFVVIISFKEL